MIPAAMGHRPMVEDRQPGVRENSLSSQVSAKLQGGLPSGLERDPWSWLLAGLIAAVVFATFFPTLSAEFNYDDDKNIVDNPHYRGLGPAQLRWLLPAQAHPASPPGSA